MKYLKEKDYHRQFANIFRLIVKTFLFLFIIINMAQYTSANKYLEELDRLLKKNRGGNVNTLYDTASNVPDQLVTALPEGVKRQDIPLEPDNIGQLGEINLPQVTRPVQTGQVLGEIATQNVQQFLEELGQIYFSPEVQQSIQPTPSYTYDQEGGYLGTDNKFYYDDGTVRESADSTAYPIASAPEGQGILYSDGSIRRNRTKGEYMSVPPVDEYGIASVGPNQTRTNLGNIREYSIGGSKPIKSFDEYLKLLSGGRLTGQDVTGRYGEYYGLPGEATNIGTDIGTGKYGSNQVNIALPFRAEVVSVDHWDNKDRYSTSTPYGNSVLVRLPTGHMMRFSHLSELGNIKAGDKIGAGTYIGTTGNTGYAFGSHLDHELYDPQGNLTSSEKFFNTLQSHPEVAKEISGGSNFQLGDIVQSQPKQNYSYNAPVEQPKQALPTNIFADYIDKTKPTGDYGVGLTELAKGDVPGAGKELASTIEKINPTGNFDLGISEYLGGNPQLAKEKQRQTAQNIGKGIASAGKTAGLPEFGISEFISQLPNIFDNQVYAAEIGQPVPNQENIFAKALAQAGSGVGNLKNELGNFINENVYKKKDLSTIGQKNKIGEDTGGTVSSNLGDMKSTPADSRNAFFKAGGLDTYKDYLSPGVTSGYRGALNTGLFSDKFYENPDNVANVFGNTSLGSEATGKYRSYMGKQYPVVEGLSPTIKRSQQYLGSYDGLMIGDEYWKDAFMRQGKDVNSGEGKSFQDRERQNQQTYSWEEPNQAYYDNEYNRSVMQSIPNVLKSSFQFTSPRTGNTSYGGMSSPQGLYQPVKGDTSVKEDYSKAKSVSQLPVSNVFRPQGQIQSIPQVLGSATNRPTIPKPVPTPSYSAPSYSAPSKPNSSFGGKPVYNPPPKPTPVPIQSRPQPNASYGGQPVYIPPSKPSAPKPAPMPAPVPTPTPKPTPKPASKPASQSNVFQNLVNYLFGRR